MSNGQKYKTTSKTFMGYIYMFALGFIACFIVCESYYYATSRQYRTLRPIVLNDAKGGSTIILPAGTELLQTQRFDDYIFDDGAYYLLIGLTGKEIARIRGFHEKQIWVQSKEEK